MKTPLSAAEWDRYQRQLALPDITPAQQIALKQARLLFVGAGGLGAPALPYLAGAGIGHITIVDHDTVSRSNLHRQTIYTDAQEGRGKAEAAAAYLRALNPHCDIKALNQKLRHCEDDEVRRGDPYGIDCFADARNDGFSYDLILDGSDNFETKDLLNRLSIAHKIPLISASVNRFEAQAGIFAGFAKSAPCYRCLFPEFPTEARNCNEAGVLGTAAGLAGLYQAHLALLYLLGIGDIGAGTVMTFDFKAMRIQKLSLPKDENCAHCHNAAGEIATKQEKPMTDMLSLDELKQKDHLIVDVRTDGEIAADPIKGALHMELSTLPARYRELPEDKLLAFVCAGNVRSVQAAQFMAAMGRSNVCVLDKFSI